MRGFDFQMNNGSSKVTRKHIAAIFRRLLHLIVYTVLIIIKLISFKHHSDIDMSMIYPHCTVAPH